MTPFRSRWPLVVWTLVMLCVPAVWNLLGWSLPLTAAFPIGFLSPLAVALWRMLR